MSNPYIQGAARRRDRNSHIVSEHRPICLDLVYSAQETMGRKKNATTIPAVTAVAAAQGVMNMDEKSAAATAGDRTTEEMEEDEEYELLQVDLGDMVKVKQILDECVAAVVLEYLPENTAWDNCKLGIMFAACCFAAVAQLNTSTFPHNRWLLGICGVMYFTLSTLLQFITTFIDQDTIVWTNALTDQNAVRSSNTRLLGPNSYYSLYMMKHHQSGTPQPLKNPIFRQHGVRVRSSLPRFSEFYSVTLELHVPKGKPADAKDGKQKRIKVSHTWSIGQFFDGTGYFDEMGLAQEIEALLLLRLEQQQYDADDTAAKNKTN
jgi:signal peptidase complex subunit 2